MNLTPGSYLSLMCSVVLVCESLGFIICEMDVEIVLPKSISGHVGCVGYRDNSGLCGPWRVIKDWGPVSRQESHSQADFKSEARDIL